MTYYNCNITAASNLSLFKPCFKVDSNWPPLSKYLSITIRMFGDPENSYTVEVDQTASKLLGNWEALYLDTTLDIEKAKYIAKCLANGHIPFFKVNGKIYDVVEVLASSNNSFGVSVLPRVGDVGDIPQNSVVTFECDETLV